MRDERMRILVVRRDNIGDLVCTTPLIAALRRKHPQAWIGALVNSYNAPVLANNDDLDEVIAYTKLKHLERGESALGAIASRLRALWRLRQRGLDLAVLATTDYSPKLIRIARLLGAKAVAGFSDGSPSATAALHCAAPVAGLERQHEVERVYRLARLLGLDPVPPPLKVVPDRSLVERARAKAGPGKVVAIHISARRAKQRWPVEHFVNLIRTTDAATLLLWAPGSAEDPRHPGDDEKARAILANAPRALGYPTQRLEELIGALAASDAVVCSDGGAMHLAAGLGKPVVAFFGDSPVERWRPWGVRHAVLRPASGNVADVSVDQAAAALLALLPR